MYEILICSDCNKKYTNVGALPQLCPECWNKHNENFNKKYSNKHIFNGNGAGGK